MKVRLSIMFQDGFEIDKKTFYARFDYKIKGILTIHRTTGQGQHGEMKVASFRSTLHTTPEPYSVLYEPVIEYLNDGNMVYSGFERKLVEGRIKRNSQSWLCREGWEDPHQPEPEDKGRR